MNNHTETQENIIAFTGAIRDLLLDKNQKYGDSALQPKRVFYKGDAVNSILIRLDDKIGRIMASHVPLINDVADIIGYCTLLLIGMGVKPEDIKKLMD